MTRPLWTKIRRRTLPLAAMLLFLLAWSHLCGAGPEPVLVLVYHRVTEESSGPAPAIKPAEFARQLDFLARAGYRSIGPQDLLHYLQGKKSFTHPAVLLTFDDGWADNYTTAWPLMRARGFVATIFVSSGRIGRRDFLTAAQLRTLAESGWSAGAHTVGHRHLPPLDPAAMREEVFRSRAAIARMTGRPVTVFAYPYGDVSPAVAAVVRKAGFQAAFGTRIGIPRPGQDPFDVRRLTVPARGGAILLRMASWPGLRPWRRCLDWALGTWPSLKAQEAYSRRLWQRTAARRSPLPSRSPAHHPLQP